MKIIVRGANWIGDAVMTIPALRALRLSFPRSEISLYTRAWAEGIFRDADFIDRIITIEDRSKLAPIKEGLRLRKEKFNAGILFPNSFESALIFKSAGIKKRIGYATDGRKLLLTKGLQVPEWKHKRHESEYYLNLIREFSEDVGGNFTIDGSGKALAVSEMRKDSARKSLDQFGIRNTPKLVALGIGSTNSTAKRWHPQRFAALADMLSAEKDAKVILVGSKEENGAAEEVLKLCKTDPTDLCGKTTLSDVTAILSVCDLMISNDMGLAHIAPAVGTPTLVIFGPTNPLTTQPLGSEIIRKSVDCSPCMLRVCPIDHRCMTEITPEEVFSAAVKLMNA